LILIENDRKRDELGGVVMPRNIWTQLIEVYKEPAPPERF
jgi:hypothetical protein